MKKLILVLVLVLAFLAVNAQDGRQTMEYLVYETNKNLDGYITDITEEYTKVLYPTEMTVGSFMNTYEGLIYEYNDLYLGSNWEMDHTDNGIQIYVFSMIHKNTICIILFNPTERVGVFIFDYSYNY